MQISKFSCQKMSLHLQSPSLRISWLQKNCASCKPETRAFCSSFPVRYRPKNPSKGCDDTVHVNKFKESECSDDPNSKLLRNEVSRDVGYVEKSKALKENVWTNENQIRSKSFMFDDGKLGLNDQTSNVMDARYFENIEESEEEPEEPNIYEMNDCHEQNVSRAGITKKDSQRLNSNEWDNSSPGLKWEEKERKDSLNLKALRTDVSNGVGYIEKSEALKENLEANQNQILTKNYMFDDGKCELEQQQTDQYLEARDFELVEEPEEDTDEPNTHATITKEDAEKLAIRLLARRAYTAVELGKKLHGKKVSRYIIETVIGDFQTRGLINDSLFAESYSRSRWSTSSWGPRRIKQGLVKKGVSQSESDKALKLVFQDSECNEDEESSKVGMSKVAMDHLLVQASKQWLRNQNVPLEKQKSRVISWLQYRGFNWGVISFILKKLESQYSSS